MKINRGDKILDFKTGNSQESNIDVFSKMEANFLEKFFRCNLTDYYPQYFVNLYEDVFDRKMNQKSQKNLASSLFLANQPIPIDEMQQKLQQFYTQKSRSLSQGQLPCGFKKLYCNTNPTECQTIKKEQLILIDVKIKTQVQKIQEFPQKILNSLLPYKNPKKDNLTQIQQIFSNYRGEYFNVFFVYFGDINFGVFNRRKYQVETVRIMGNLFKLRIFVFFVSKQGLLETFTTLNKIENLEVINDLVVQFYMIKRLKQRQKRNKQPYQIVNPVVAKQRPEYTHIALGVVGVISLTIFGIAIKKLFF